MTIEEMLELVSNGEDSPAYELCDLLRKNDFMQATKVIKNYLRCDENTAKIVCMDFKTKIYDDIYKLDESLTPTQIAHNNAVAQELLKKPKCPTCQSTNVQKIDVFERIGSVYLLGFFSNKFNKSFECKNCGYTW